MIEFTQLDQQTRSLLTALGLKLQVENASHLILLNYDFFIL